MITSILTIVGMVVLMLSPVLVPAVITLVHALTEAELPPSRAERLAASRA